MCFPKEHSLYAICNRNSIKISYSCSNVLEMPLMFIIKKIISMYKNKNEYPSIFPLNNKCLATNVVYKATVTSVEDKNNEKFYIGISSTDFKTRYNIHKSSFKNINSRNHTMLSKHVWFLKK